MAISRSQLVAELEPGLNALFGMEYDNYENEHTEIYSIEGLADITPGKSLKVTAEKQNGDTFSFEVIARLDTEVDVTYFQHGGILPYVLRQMMKEK